MAKNTWILQYIYVMAKNTWILQYIYVMAKNTWILQYIYVILKNTTRKILELKWYHKTGLFESHNLLSFFFL